MSSDIQLRAQREFSGTGLSEIAFPLGGIGTGTISIGGRGNLRDFEIFGHPDKGRLLPFTFFALWAKPQSGKPVARILEGALPPPYRSGFGESPEQLTGVPRFRNASFRGEYPSAHIRLEDPAMPVTARLEAWNPFIPLDVHDSPLPIAIFEWTIENPGAVPVEVSLAASLSNPLSALGEDGKRSTAGALTSRKISAALRGIEYSNPAAKTDDPATGTLALSTPWADTDLVSHWYRSGWFDKQHLFWDQFAESGRVEIPGDDSPAPNQGDVASILLHAVVPAGGVVTLPISIAWLFPRMENPWRCGHPLPETLDTYAGAHFGDAWVVAEYAHAHIARLKSGTRAWRDTIFESTLPSAVIEAISSQASILRTTTCFLLADGRFFGWEGCGDSVGSCHGSCTHVWNYEQALAFLFPELERTMRETEFLHNTLANGLMCFRTELPPGGGFQNFPPCADGQMGTIIQFYRDWQLSGDEAFLKALWPKVKKALEYAWTMTPAAVKHLDAGPSDAPTYIAPAYHSSWDPDKDGVMEGVQHNTYDIEFFGANTFCSGMYLGALRACEEVARHLGEIDKADEYRAIFESGRKKLDELLWNGEYYIQRVNVIPEVDVPKHLQSPGEGGERRPKYQYGEGCLSDQLLGQWAASIAGLGAILPEDHVRSAVRSIYRYNFRPSLAEHANVQRTYGCGDEAGLLLCTWPGGGREVLPFPYCDEVWTGIEYHVAAHLIMEGSLDEGLAIVNAVAGRYAGFNRNPWNQIECGHHYARAMSSWSVKLALDGFTYSMPASRLGFAPRLGREAYSTFWSTGTGWGRYEQDLASGRFSLSVLAGELTLRNLDLADLPAGRIEARGPAGPVDAARLDGGIELTEALTLHAGEGMVVTAG